MSQIFYSRELQYSGILRFKADDEFDVVLIPCLITFFKDKTILEGYSLELGRFNIFGESRLTIQIGQ